MAFYQLHRNKRDGDIFFVAIVNHQSDKVHELNVNLERKVNERTRHLRETQAQLIQSEKMATLGHLVTGENQSVVFSVTFKRQQGH